MAKRDKRLKKSIESFKEQIEKHFKKLDNDLNKKDEINARYHIKEIDRSLIATLEKKMKLLGKNTEEDKEMLDKFKRKLEEYKKMLSIESKKSAKSS